MFASIADRILAPADRHQHLALGAELDEHVGAFVDRPDVVLRVDAHRVREREAVVVAADLAHERALRRVLEQPRLVGAVVDVDVALRVGGDAHVLAGVDAGRVLEEVGHRFVRDHGTLVAVARVWARERQDRRANRRRRARARRSGTGTERLMPGSRKAGWSGDIASGRVCTAMLGPRRAGAEAPGRTARPEEGLALRRGLSDEASMMYARRGAARLVLRTPASERVTTLAADAAVVVHRAQALEQRDRLRDTAGCAAPDRSPCPPSSGRCAPRPSRSAPFETR